MPVTRSKGDIFSRHTSNPFDDADWRRALGCGSSELSELSSDSALDGYGDVTVRLCEEENTENADEGMAGTPTGKGTDNADDPGDTFIWSGSDPGISDEMDISEDWDEEEFEEENSIYFKPAEERQEIEEEIADLEKAVPQLKADYELLDRLGTGTFSSVYKAIDRNYEFWDSSAWRGNHPTDSSAFYQSKAHDTSRKFFLAVKRIYVTSMPDRIRNELSILEDVRGCRHVSQLITAFRHSDQIVAIMPYHRHEDFRNFIHKLSMNGIKDYMRCLFRGLRDIHARGIIHRDIKPANFLFDPRAGIGTICDLGLACRMNYDEESACNHTAPSKEYPHGRYKPREEIPFAQIRSVQQSAKIRNKYPPDRVGYPENDTRPQSKANRAGTRGFRSPEVLLKCASQSGAVDIWSAGTMLLFFLTGKFPLFHCPNDTEAFVELAVLLGKKAMDKAALLHNRVIITNIPSIEPQGKDLREFVIALNPDIFAKSWTSDSDTEDQIECARQKHEEDVEQAIDLLNATLQVESIKRITARDALYHPFLREEGMPGDDEYFPHPVGYGVCGKLHWKDEVTEEVFVRAKEGAPAKKVLGGEYVPIGNKSCKLHEMVEAS